MRLEVFTAVTVKSAVFWDIKAQLRLRYRTQPVNAMQDLRFSRR
jgi:hypothetical protein